MFLKVHIRLYGSFDSPRVRIRSCMHVREDVETQILTLCKIINFLKVMFDFGKYERKICHRK